ncbi:MAG: MFS transporter [Candidatus Shapirobacteria bacterium]
MKKNIKIAYFLSFLSELYFPISVWLFYYLRFLDFKQIGVLTAVKLISSNLFEVPTGVFADVFGRKKAIVISFFLYGLVMLGFANVSVFWMFIVLDVLKALSNAFFSGSLEALIYDSLKNEGKESQYDKVVANMESMAWVGLFISAIGGGYLYYYWFRSPYIVQGGLYLVAAVIALRLVEPKIDSQKFKLSEAIKFNLVGFKELFANSKVSQLSTIFITLGAGYFIASEMLGISQAKEYGMDSRGVGFLFGTGYIVSAIASQFYPRLKRWLGVERLLLIAAGILLGSFLLAKWVGVVVGSLLIIGRISSSTTFRNTRSSVINGLVNSKSRATTISTLVLLSQLPMALMAYFMGDYIDKNSPNSLAWVLGLVMIGLLVGQLIVFRRKGGLQYPPCIIG